MKKGILALASLILVAFLLSPVVAEDDGPWFDMENCVFCKNMAAEPGLLDHMTIEYHNLDNGFLMVAAATPEYKEKYLHMQKKMQETAQSMMSAKEMPPMCPHCTAYGELMMTPGIKSQDVATFAGDVSIMTSDNPELVKKLQAFADRTAAETAKYHEKKAEE